MNTIDDFARKVCELEFTIDLGEGQVRQSLLRTSTKENGCGLAIWDHELCIWDDDTAVEQITNGIGACYDKGPFAELKELIGKAIELELVKTEPGDA